MAISTKDVMPTTFKGIGENYGRLHQQFAWMGAVFSYYRFGCNQKGNQENGRIILLFSEWHCSCCGVEAESELESESIFPGRSRSLSWSRLKSVDFAALVETFSTTLRCIIFRYSNWKCVKSVGVLTRVRALIIIVGWDSNGFRLI